MRERFLKGEGNLLEERGYRFFECVHRSYALVKNQVLNLIFADFFQSRHNH
jgi:hypothetical protein